MNLRLFALLFCFAPLASTGCESKNLGGPVVISKGPVPQHGMLGISMERQETGFVRVALVMPNTPADAAGIRVGDVIQAIDGRPTNDMDTLWAYLKTTKPGMSVTLVVFRDGKTESVQVRLLSAAELATLISQKIDAAEPIDANR